MSLRRSMAKGAAWMVGLRFFVRTIGLFSTIILARLLAPEDFGLVAMVTVIMGLIMMMSELNVEAVLVQRPHIDDSLLNGAFGLKLLVSAGQGILLAGMAVPMTIFYSEPRLEPIVYILACAVVVSGLQNPGAVAFQRELRFHREFVMKAVPKLAAFVVTVGIALATRSYWALVAGIATNFTGRTLFSYLLHPYRPRPTREHWSEIFRFSKWLVLNQALDFIGRRGPELALGRLLGASSVGLFTVSHEISRLPTTEMVAPINRAVFSGYSRMDRTDGELQRGFLDVIGLIALVAMPAGFGIAVTAPILIPLLLGDRWDDAIPLVQALGLAGAMHIFLSNVGPVFLALGRPYVLTAFLAIEVTLLTVGVIYGGQTAGMWGVAIAYVIVKICMVPIQIISTLYVLSLGILDFIRCVYRPVLAATLMYLFMYRVIMPDLLMLELPLILAGLLAVVSGAALHIGTCLLLWYVAGRPIGAESQMLDIARATLVRMWPRTS